MTNTARTPGAPPVRRPHSRAATITDTVVGLVLILIGVWNMLTQLGLEFRAPNEGLGVPLKILSVVSWVIGVALFVVFKSRRRFAFYWPIVGIALMYGSALLMISIAQANA